MNKFQKTIIFTKTPLKKSFLYPNKFQIYPADLQGMPFSKFQEHFPAILEYKIESEDIITPTILLDEDLKDLSTLTATTTTKQDEILSLLTSFTNHLFFRYSDLTGNWGIPMLSDDPGEEANKWSSKWNLKMFHWPELPEQLNIDKFSEIANKYNSIDLIPFKEYFQNNPNFDFDKKRDITFPDTIKLALDRYYNLEKDEKEIITIAISHCSTATELKQIKKTLSVISAFTAIETMVNFENKEFKEDKCNECGQLKFKVSKKYQDYLLKYVGTGNKNKKKINAYYSLRSKIIHTGAKFKTENLWSNLPEEDKDKEYLNQMEVILISKLAIMNWLLINKKN